MATTFHEWMADVVKQQVKNVSEGIHLIIEEAVE